MFTMFARPPKRAFGPVSALMISILLLVPVAKADEAARQRLIDVLQSTETLQARFRQETYADGELRGDQSEGVMKIARPLKFAWHVTVPYEQSVISDGQTLWVHDPDLLQATYQPVTGQLEESPAMILSQPGSALNSSYEVTEASNDSLTAFRLYPTGNDSVFESMTLLFEAGKISELRLSDNLGQDTRITFSEVQTDLTLDDAEFEFTPPEGTDVFEQM